MLQKLLKHFQKKLDLLDWKGKIVFDKISYIVFDKQTKEFLLGVAWYHIFILPKIIIHELLHLKYPEKSEKEIEFLEDYEFLKWLLKSD